MANKSKSKTKIEEDKAILGFQAGWTPLYRKWRDVVKAHMTANGFNSLSTAGTKKWAVLTDYALTLKPLSARASVHGTATPAGIAMQASLRNLLGDAGKKLKDTQALYGDVQLVESPEADSATPVRKGTLTDLFTPVISRASLTCSR